MNANSSSADEIPYKPKKTQDTEEEIKTGYDSDESDLAEDEYAVEKIIGHRFVKKGKLELLLKWQGYPIEEATWEPEENLEGCPEDLKAYYDELGGRPGPKDTKSASRPGPSKKRKLSLTAVSGSSPIPTRPGKTKQQSRQNGSASLGPADGIFPDGSWEDLVVSIDNMEQDDKTGKIYAYLVWKDNSKTKHPTEVIYMKCPQKCLQFYEAHLVFHTPAPLPPADVISVQSSTVKDDDIPDFVANQDNDVDNLEVADPGIKSVVSALS